MKPLSHISRLLNDDLETFYWIGFILADGYIVDYGKHKVLGIELSKKDENHLWKFAKLIGNVVHYRSRSTNYAKTTETCFVKTSNDSINDIMEKYDIHLNKTNNPPDVSKWNFTDDQLLSLIIGFIDGDGSISNRTNQYGSKSTMISMQNNSKWKPFLEFVRNYIVENIDEKFRGRVQNNCRNHAYLCITRSSVINYMQQFSIENNLPIVKRKWNKIKTED